MRSFIIYTVHQVQGDFLNENPMNSMYKGRAGGLK
jgi:hypothetical protein